MSYRTYNNFGKTTCVSPNDPMTYLFNTGLGASFIMGHQDKDIGKGTAHYRNYFSDRCANSWDKVCMIATADCEAGVPVNKGDYRAITYDNLTQGELLLRDISGKKYLRGVTAMSTPKVTQYDLLVPSSPFVSSFNDCKKAYGVDAAIIDSDPVMNQILTKPEISPYVLINIYKNAMANNSLETLRGTKLYAFFKTDKFKMIQEKYSKA